MRNVVLESTPYGDGPSQFWNYDGNVGQARKYYPNETWGVGPSGTRASVVVSFYNDYGRVGFPNSQAGLLAAELFLATPGRLYHGTSSMNGTYTMDPYDVSQSPADASYRASMVALAKNGAFADTSHYNLEANVSFINRTITTGVEIRLANGRRVDSTVTTDFPSQDVRANTSISMPNQLPVSIYGGAPIMDLELDEIIKTNARPSASELQHSVVYEEGGSTYTGGATTRPRS